MKYTFNIWFRIWGRILYGYGMLWYPLYKIIPFKMDSKLFVFVLKRFGLCRNPYYEISYIERKEQTDASKR